jgi:hypothetical protein
LKLATPQAIKIEARISTQGLYFLCGSVLDEIAFFEALVSLFKPTESLCQSPKPDYPILPANLLPTSCSILAQNQIGFVTQTHVG